MPLHLLGKKSWNVYNPANIARVKADEAAAAAREAADEQRMQELDAERRAAILRGQTPPPLPEDESPHKQRSDRNNDGHDRKRRRIAGEDDTDRDIRLARTVSRPGDEDNAAVLRLRQPKSDAPLTDHAGNINLFPVDLKGVGRREKNAEVEKEKKERERAFEDQYTMRFQMLRAEGGALENPWYATSSKAKPETSDSLIDTSTDYSGFESKNVWGREDPARKDRQQARISSNDPLAFMNKAQVQLKKSKEDRKKWAEEKGREVQELWAAEEREHRRDRYGKRRKHDEDDVAHVDQQKTRRRSSRERHRHKSRSRSRSRDRKHDRDSSRRQERKRSRSRNRERDQRHDERLSSHRRKRASPTRESHGARY